jgi:serine protease inhibitor
MIVRGMNRRAFLQSGLALTAGAAAKPAFADLAAGIAGPAAPGLLPDLVLPAQLKLGHGLIERLARGPGANVMVSPASLAAVLAMLSSGASRPLRHAIHHVLGFRDGAWRPAGRDVSAVKAAVAHILSHSGGESPLALANMIVFDPASSPYPQALARLSVEGADVSVEDLSKAETIQRINEWVSERTHTLIPSILNDPLSHPGLVALNALYFKDKWSIPFDPAQTRTEKFYRVGGSSVDASMMYSPEGHFRFRQDDRFIAVELAYASDDYKLIVVTTKRKPTTASEFAGAQEWLSGRRFAAQAGMIALPRIAMSGDLELLRTLDAMGLAPPRQSPHAFRGFCAVPQSLSRVVQKTELRIDESGTEAAAATAVTTWRQAATDAYTRMVVNKPFVFALRNARTGLVLLSGYVATATPAEQKKVEKAK